MRNLRVTMRLSEMIARTGDTAEVIETVVFVRSDFSICQWAEQTIFYRPWIGDAEQESGKCMWSITSSRSSNHTKFPLARL